jgi:hypothetical protein
MLREVCIVIVEAFASIVIVEAFASIVIVEAFASFGWRFAIFHSLDPDVC